MKEIYDLIENELKKIEDELFNKYNIRLIKQKEIQYGINFDVFVNNENFKTIAMYYKPKKKAFTFTSNVVPDDIKSKIEETFDKRDYIEIVEKKDSSKEIYLISRIDYYYEILKKYRYEEFDFIDLAKAINEYFTFKKVKMDVLKYNFEFDVLEKFYSEIEGENGGY